MRLETAKRVLRIEAEAINGLIGWLDSRIESRAIRLPLHQDHFNFPNPGAQGQTISNFTVNETNFDTNSTLSFRGPESL
jgi:hypothetical protein